MIFQIEYKFGENQISIEKLFFSISFIVLFSFYTY